MEDECDIETLAAFLDESSDEEFPEESNRTSQNGDIPSSASPHFSVNCVKGRLTKQPTSNGEVENDVEALASFLGESSDEEFAGESNGPMQKRKSSDSQTTALPVSVTDEETRKDHLKKRAVHTVEEPHDTTEKTEKNLKEDSNNSSLEDELLKMQQKVAELQRALIEKNQVANQEDRKQQKSNIKLVEENLFMSKDENTSVSRSGSCKNEALEANTKESEKALFGQDSDSDWDDMDGDRPELSKEGKELKKLISAGPKKREAHKPAWNDETMYKKESQKKTPPQKSTVASSSTMKSTFSAKIQDREKNAAEDSNSIQCTFSHISIVNPTFSQTSFNSRMKDKKMIKMSRIHNRINTTDLQGDWVTMGVIIFKSDAKQSSTGKTFCSWKLSDLEECDKEITFFLFGNVYQQHWKNSVGTVVGILNCEKMENAEKSKLGIAFTVKQPQQVMVMGTSKDLGRCSSKSRNGNPCTNAINKRQGDFCTYHVQSAYKKTFSKRSELSNSYTGITPKSFEQKIFSNMGKNDAFFYGGQMYSNAAKSTSSANKNKVTLGKLQQMQSVQGKTKVTTMSLHEILPEDKKKLEQLQEKKDSFMDMITAPTVGSMNLVKHILKKDPDEKDSPTSSKAVVQSISAKDLIKQHKIQMRERREQRKLSSMDPLSELPKIGKNLQPGQNIFLDSSQMKRTPVLGAEYAKTAAIQKLKSKGGIQEEDPNAVKKTLKSPEHAHQIKKRVLEDISKDSSVQNEMNNGEPPKKKSRLLGDVDLDSDEVKQLLKASSKHNGALSKIQSERQEKYFNELEKKEKYEEKLESIKEMECTAYCCRQCKYLAYKIGDKCKAENHSTFSIKTKKRFFKCKHCSFRTTVLYNKYPSKSCSHCGSSSFERTSACKVKEGPKLESEILSLRGDEIQNLSSMNQKVFLNV